MSSSKFDEMMGKIKNYNGGGYFVFDKSNRVNDPPSYSGQKSNNGAAGYYNGGGNGVPASAVAGTNYQESSNAPQFSSSYKVISET